MNQEINRQCKYGYYCECYCNLISKCSNCGVVKGQTHTGGIECLYTYGTIDHVDNENENNSNASDTDVDDNRSELICFRCALKHNSKSQPTKQINNLKKRYPITLEERIWINFATGDRESWNQLLDYFGDSHNYFLQNLENRWGKSIYIKKWFEICKELAPTIHPNLFWNCISHLDRKERDMLFQAKYDKHFNLKNIQLLELNTNLPLITCFKLLIQNKGDLVKILELKARGAALPSDP